MPRRKKKFASTYVPGFTKVVHEHLTKVIKDAAISQDIEGMVVFETHANPGMIKSIRFLNNSFIVYQEYQESNVGEMLAHLSEEFILEDDYMGTILGFARSFKLVFSDEKTTGVVSKSQVAKLENRLSTFTGLLATKEKADVEFWCLNRAEGYGFFGLRLTDKRVLDRHLHTKEVHSGLAHLLCLISEPKPGDVFLDPFATTGEIAMERAHAGEYGKIIAIAETPGQAQILKSNLQYKNLEVHEATVKNIEEIPHDSVDKIVTKPEWSCEQEIMRSPQQNYDELLHQTERILKPEGVAVVMTDCKDQFVSALQNVESSLKVVENYNVVVDNKDSGVYKVVKTQNAQAQTNKQKVEAVESIAN